MTLRQFDSERRDRDDATDAPDTIPTPVTGDTSIIEGNPEPPVRGPGGQLLRIEVGAQVYSSDGDDVAVVEITNADTIGIRAGSPGRSIVVPASGIARVAADGKRVDLYASTREVRDLSGANQPGSRHLAAQQPETLARDSRAETGGPEAGNASPGTGGAVGRAEDAPEGHGAR
jgi:hypothetical protein